MSKGRFQGGDCQAVADASERPGGVGPYQRLGLGKAAYQGWHGRAVTDVSEGHADVPLEADPLSPLDGAVAEALAEGVVVELEEGQQGRGAEVVPLLEGGLGPGVRCRG